ncbi:glycosyltransferase [Gluconacetobacter takamatsuzukensis]|uniref:Glycosyltransferase n=2 Tax=Gluconacetobacter takamatsuzukensis TaxID=1286190 RepID=A0A7W4KFK6_9PROT|nr:glycosyltransferase [Gluconacetobacter takamatsuzukensis]MBB2206009.1 glycosyltransferase [Gluconacetobacter takamatsuzukensis]
MRNSHAVPAQGAAGRTEQGPRIAVIHEWLEKHAGSEHVLEQILLCYPSADVFVVADFMPPKQRGFLDGHAVRTSFIQKLPFARKHFRKFLGLMPLAVEQFDLTGYDLVISSHHAVAKGVITGPDQLHVSYVHSPMRYAWDLQARYLEERGLRWGAMGLYTRWLLHRLRNWDARSASGVDLFVANSHYIARRVQKAWRREALVLNPPVAVDKFCLSSERQDFYLVVSRFVPYKRIDLIAEAFSRMPDRRLVIVGEGEGDAAIRAAAAGCANIEIRKPVRIDELVSLMGQARAFVFAAAEDFGIVMAEAQACGTPVIAYGVGGACDIVIDADAADPTGLLFAEQTAEAIVAAVRAFEQKRHRIRAETCRANAMRFSEAEFRRRFMEIVDEAIAARASQPPAPAGRIGAVRDLHGIVAENAGESRRQGLKDEVI